MPSQFPLREAAVVFASAAMTYPSARSLQILAGIPSREREFVKAENCAWTCGAGRDSILKPCLAPKCPRQDIPEIAAATKIGIAILTIPQIFKSKNYCNL